MAFECQQYEKDDKHDDCSQMKLSTDITKREGQEHLPTTPKNEEEELDKSTKTAKIADDKAERLNQLKQFLKAQLNISEHTKGEALQQALQKVDTAHLKQLVQQFNQMQSKNAYSTPPNMAEKENCQI